MPVKRSQEAEDRVDILGGVYIKLRGRIWQIYMPIKGRRDAKRLSLKTDDRDAAVARAQQMVLEVERTGMSPDLVYNLTVTKAIDSYLEMRADDIHTGSGLDGITPERWKTIKTQLGHWRAFLGGETLVSTLRKESGKPYKEWRRGHGVALSTIRNEQSAMNSVIKMLYEKDQIGFRKLTMAKIYASEVSTRNNPRTNSFTPEEMEKIEPYLAHIKHKSRDLGEKLSACYFLFQIGTAIRPKEALKLQWQEISRDSYKIRRADGQSILEMASKSDPKVETTELCGIDMPAAKAKNRKRRFVRFFDKSDCLLMLITLQKGRKDKIDTPLRDQLLFRHNGMKSISTDTYLKLWHKMLKELEITTNNRHLEPKSFRHFYITSRISAGHPMAQIAEIAGTSEYQIRQTYYHLFDEANVKSALYGIPIVSGNVLL